ncbi:MAG: hypothetical protein M3N18_11875 [Actinomycetota bacterium]|nr:hypothetical protein [Actinomycetota bacterium]
MRLDFNALPPTEVLEGMDDLRTLVEEHATTLGEWRDGKAEYEQLQAALVDARHMDEAAGVEAYRAGSKDPGDKHQAKVRKALEEHAKYMTVREGALTSIEREISGAAQRARAKIPAIEAAVRKDNARMAELLEEVRGLQTERAKRRGLVEWLTKLPPSFRPITHTASGMTEDVALNVLLGSTVEPEEGTVRLVG